jgi:hypothetical protein
VLAALAGWHGWMTLSLFGSDSAWEQLGNDQPVITGRHAGNFYLGMMAAKARLATGSACCYDPADYVGYPRTPIFNGSRLSELFMLAVGGEYYPQAYKIGLAVVALLVPFCLFLAARAANACLPAAGLATALGLLVWWGNPSQEALRAGDIELLVAGLAVLLHAGLLVRFHQAPGFFCWFGLLVSGALAWLGQPLLLPLFVPLWLLYYLTVGAKHPALTWHLALVGSLAGSVAMNLFWLIDWVNFWWLRSPLPHATSLLPHRTLQTLWNAPIWGGCADRMLAALLLASAVAGAWRLNQTRQRPAARLLGLGAGGLLTLALLGVVAEPLGRMGASTLLPLALFFAALPAAHAWVQVHRWAFARLGTRWVLAGEMCLVGGLIFLAQEYVPAVVERFRAAEPLVIGLGPEREAVVEKLIRYTGPEARILWECVPLPKEAPHWAALLPLLTERVFIGGLDPEAAIEHAGIGIIDQSLNGRHISAWSTAMLEDYCRLYNIGWVACWSPAVAKRMQQWPGAELVCELEGDGPGLLFAVKHHVPSYTLKGQARLVHADSHHITLADVVPENGEVVLSLHFQRGMRALPSRVQLDCYQDPYDPIGFLRLKVAGPVARVTLTWDDR